MARGKIEKRGSRKRTVKPIVLIVTEGSKTEPQYFEHFRNRQTNIDIRIVGSRSNGGKTDYSSLLKKAREIQEKNQLSPATGDSVWILADADINLNGSETVEQKNNQLMDLRATAARFNIETLISNPCFELWYILHFKYTTKYFQDYNVAKQELSSYIPNYEKSGDIYPILKDKMSAAIHHAKQLEQYHIKNGACLPLSLKSNPFTEVYKLVELLNYPDVAHDKNIDTR